MQQLTESTVIPYLKEKGYITPEEPARVTFLPSNVNFVYRVDTPTKSFVVKQGRGSLARFPDVPCSIRRTETEYRAISVWRTYGNPAAVPHALFYDKENNIIIFAAMQEAWNAYEKEFSFLHIQQVKKNVLQHMGAFL